jgi:hypothetical protein
MITKLHYRVSTFREAGLEAKWSKTRIGKPYLVGRQCGQKTWFVITSDMFERMEEIGVMEGFEEFTLLGDVFSISVSK